MQNQFFFSGEEGEREQADHRLEADHQSQKSSGWKIFHFLLKEKKHQLHDENSSLRKKHHSA
jgi:hypothetical protein